MKKALIALGAAIALVAGFISGCGTSSSTSATGCEGNLPCTVSTNIN